MTPREGRVIGVSPASMQLAFEPRTSRAVSVEARLVGRPAAGFRVGRIVITPDEVAVSGAQSVVDGILRVMTAPVSVAFSRAPLSRKVDLAPLPPHAEYVNPEPVRVEVEVTPLSEGVGREAP